MTPEEIDAFVQEKVYGNLLPWEKVKRPTKGERKGGTRLKTQERILRAIIAAAAATGLANREVVREATGYSDTTHWMSVQELVRKGAIRGERERCMRPRRRHYVLCWPNSTEEG